MADLIDRQAAIDALAKFVPYAICDESTESYTNGLTDAYNLICQLPSAQPEIIRCKDCKHWKIGTEYLRCPNPAVCGLHSFMHSFERAALPEDYCSWAVRRSDERQT